MFPYYGMTMVLTDSLSEPCDVIAASEPTRLAYTGIFVIEYSSTSSNIHLSRVATIAI